LINSANIFSSGHPSPVNRTKR